MDFETRLATHDDHDELFAVYALAMKGHIAKIWGWDDAWQQTDFDTHFDPNAIQVAIVGDTPEEWLRHRIVAYIQTELRDGTPHVRILCVIPDYQRRGIGSTLLKSLIKNCSINQQTATLGVFKINTDARRFYERLGFEVVETTSTHYLMRRNA